MEIVLGAILRDGFEGGGSASSTGWFSTGTPMTVRSAWAFVSGLYSKTINPRKDLLGNGGEYFIGDSGGTTGDKYFIRGAREFFVRVPYNVAYETDNDTYYASFMDLSNVSQCRIKHLANTSSIVLERDTTTLATSPAGIAAQAEDWRVLNMHVFIDDTDGFIKVYKDYDFSSTVAEVTSADTKHSTTSEFAWYLRFSLDNSAIDDVAVNDITMTYTNGSGGHPSVGDIITGNTSLSTAIVTSVYDRSGSSPNLTGTMQLRKILVGGTSDWSGDPSTDPFAGDSGITSTNLTSATISGLDKNSGAPRDSYFFGLRPSADSSIELTAVGGAGSNASHVDDRPMDDATALTTYVETSTLNDRDLYELEDISARGFGPGDISSIVTIEIDAVADRGGSGPNSIFFVHEDVDGDSGEVESSSQFLAFSPDGRFELLESAPDGTDWDSGAATETKVNDLRVGARLRFVTIIVGP